MTFASDLWLPNLWRSRQTAVFSKFEDGRNVCIPFPQLKENDGAPARWGEGQLRPRRWRCRESNPGPRCLQKLFFTCVSGLEKTGRTGPLTRLHHPFISSYSHGMLYDPLVWFTPDGLSELVAHPTPHAALATKGIALSFAIKGDPFDHSTSSRVLARRASSIHHVETNHPRRLLGQALQPKLLYPM